MNPDILSMYEGMAENGIAPVEGCKLFGVGYEDAFSRLQRVYLNDRLQRGGSAEKFVIGPFGSGKTHFLRQLMELARDAGCMTSEVALSKDVDFTRNLMVYTEVARAMRPPTGDGSGMKAVLEACVSSVASRAPEDLQAKVLEGWIGGLGLQDFADDTYCRVAQRALKAHQLGNQEHFIAATRWLSGDVSSKELAKVLNVSVVAKSEENAFGRRALLSLFQLIRSAQFSGTVVSFDEAEQGLSVSRRKAQMIHSVLQSTINAVAALRNGSALLVYALTPEMIDEMASFAALQQRIADPAPGMGFFDGNTMAVKIDLAGRRGDPVGELREIGDRLVDLFYEHLGPEMPKPESEVTTLVQQMAEQVAEDDPHVSSRRTMVKRVCSVLVQLHRGDELGRDVAAAKTVEDEV